MLNHLLLWLALLSCALAHCVECCAASVHTSTAMRPSRKILLANAPYGKSDTMIDRFSSRRACLRQCSIQTRRPKPMMIRSRRVARLLHLFTGAHVSSTSLMVRMWFFSAFWSVSIAPHRFYSFKYQDDRLLGCASKCKLTLVGSRVPIALKLPQQIFEVCLRQPPSLSFLPVPLIGSAAYGLREYPSPS
jgi:hypothetical protein